MGLVEARPMDVEVLVKFQEEMTSLCDKLGHNYMKEDHLEQLTGREIKDLKTSFRNLRIHIESKEVQLDKFLQIDVNIVPQEEDGD